MGIEEQLAGLPEGQRRDIEQRLSRSVAEANAIASAAQAPIFGIAEEVSPAELGWARVAPLLWQKDGRAFKFPIGHREVFIRLVPIAAGA